MRPNLKGADHECDEPAEGRLLGCDGALSPSNGWLGSARTPFRTTRFDCDDARPSRVPALPDEDLGSSEGSRRCSHREWPIEDTQRVGLRGLYVRPARRGCVASHRRRRRLRGSPRDRFRSRADFLPSVDKGCCRSASNRRGWRCGCVSIFAASICVTDRPMTLCQRGSPCWPRPTSVSWRCQAPHSHAASLTPFSARPLGNIRTSYSGSTFWIALPAQPARNTTRRRESLS